MLKSLRADIVVFKQTDASCWPSHLNQARSCQEDADWSRQVWCGQKHMSYEEQAHTHCYNKTINKKYNLT